MNDWLLRPTAAIDPTARAAARARQRQLTKPPGALGRLETLAEDFAGWQGRAVPRLERVDVCVFAADHGVAARGVSALLVFIGRFIRSGRKERRASPPGKSAAISWPDRLPQRDRMSAGPSVPAENEMFLRLTLDTQLADIDLKRARKVLDRTKGSIRWRNPVAFFPPQAQVVDIDSGTRLVSTLGNPDQRNNPGHHLFSGFVCQRS